MIERRARRSRIPHEAVSLLMEAAAARSGATAAALADEEGLLLGGAGEGCDLEKLAALGAECARRSPGSAHVDAMLEALAGEEDLYASPVRVGASTCYLTSLGARIRRQQEVAVGVARILGPWAARGGAATASAG